MAKQQSNVERLEADLSAAREGEAQAQEQATAARQAYKDAVDAGDMAAAADRQAEVEEQDRQARLHADRVATLEAKRGEAEAADAMPAYKAAMKEAEASIQAEAEAHHRVADLIQQLAEARQELDRVHSDTGGAIAAAHRAADAAHQARPEFTSRTRFEAVADLGKLADLSRELRNMAGHQAQTMQAARERARKAA